MSALCWVGVLSGGRLELYDITVINYLQRSAKAEDDPRPKLQGERSGL